MYNITNILTPFCKVYLRLFPYFATPFVRLLPYFLCSNFRVFYTRGQNMSIFTHVPYLESF